MNPVFPSILSTNFFNLKHKLDQFQDVGIDYIHLDVMDGHFVDNISFGPSMLKAIKDNYNFKVDTHLMVSNPEKSIKTFIERTDWISFHIEVNADFNKCIEIVKTNNKKVGMVLNPSTPLDKLIPYLEKLDYVLLMSVFAGYGGQRFISETKNKVKELKKIINKKNYNCLIQVDGGINDKNIGSLVEAGADSFVIGTFLFNSENIEETMYSIKNEINRRIK